MFYTLILNPSLHTAITTAAPLTQIIRRSLAQPSVSAGVGLVYCFDPIRVEVNFAVPLVAARSDGLHRGFQAGVGMEFM